MAEPKYITVNGVLKKNPDYVVNNAATSSASAAPVAHAVPANLSTAPLAVVSSVSDVMDASEIKQRDTGLPVPLAESTEAAVEMMQDDDILSKYKSSVPLDGGTLLDELGEVFAQHEVPLGMVNKLLMLSDRKLDFLFDDSYSMGNRTDVDVNDATTYLQTAICQKLKREPRVGEKMSRWQEAEDRFHIMIDVLAYTPVEHIQLRFLNSKDVIVLDRSAKTPAEFKSYAHDLVRQRFERQGPCGSTPVAAALQAGFDNEGNWSHYLFNDGEPNEGGARIAHQIIHRKYPEKHALTLISCTNNDEETAWMKQVDNDATWVAELDDYQDEKVEVVKKQGTALPYTRGLWILSQLVASINPYDLDALDENLPLTKSTLDNILGRKLSPNEYQYYFEKNPNAALYVSAYSRFLSEDCFAQEIIPKQQQLHVEQQAGYRDGERPAGRPLANISAHLQVHTDAATKKFAEDLGVAPPPPYQASVIPNSIFTGVTGSAQHVPSVAAQDGFSVAGMK